MSTLAVKTIKLQEMVSKAVKGAGNNKHIPLTSLMEVKLENNVFSLMTTDASNYLKVIEEKFPGDNFYAVVECETFAKLIAKTTVDTITLMVNADNALEVKGNGKYVIELPLDEEGNLIRFPQYKMMESKWQKGINLSSVKSILAVNKAALAETMEVPCYTAYYVGKEAVVTTDTFKICYNAIGLFDEDILLPAETMNLIGLMTDEKITVDYDGAGILFVTDNCIVYGLTADGIDNFNLEAITGFVQSDFPSSCKLPKSALLSLLDRLGLFVTTYDNNGVNFVFSKEGVIVNSKKQTGSELIKYQDSKNFQPYSCIADIQLLRSQINAIDEEVVELWYGHPAALKLTHRNVTQIVSLLDDETDGVSDSDNNGE